MLNEELLNILACPKCGGDLELKDNHLVCKNDNLSYPIVDGIPLLLAEEAKEI